MNKFQYVYQLNGDCNDLSIFLDRWAFEIFKELAKLNAVFRHYIKPTFDSFLSSAILVGEIFELENSMTDHAGETDFMERILLLEHFLLNNV